MENENKELAKAGRAELIVPADASMNFGDIQRLATCMIQSGFFKGIKDVAQAAVKIMAGQDLGISPVRSLMTINFINDKLSFEASVMAGAAKRHGYNYTLVKEDDEEVSIRFYDAAGTVLGVSSFTYKEATAAQLTTKSNWKNYRRDMLWARAMSRGIRRYCPDVFGGAVYTPEELEDSTEQHTVTIERTAPAEDLTAILKGKKAKDTINRSNPLENGGTFPAVSEASELTLEQSEIPNV